MRTKLAVLLEKVNEEVENAQRITQASRDDASSIGASLQGSRSTAGDHYHAKQQAEMNKDRLRNLLSLQKNLKQVVDTPVSEVVEAPAFVKIPEGEYYLVETPTTIDGYSFISAASPKGQEILGKKVGEIGIEMIE